MYLFFIFLLCRDVLSAALFLNSNTILTPLLLSLTESKNENGMKELAESVRIVVTGSCDRLGVELLLLGHRGGGSDAEGLTRDRDRVTVSNRPGWKTPLVFPLAQRLKLVRCVFSCFLCSPNRREVWESFSKLRRFWHSWKWEGRIINCSTWFFSKTARFSENLPDMVKPFWTWTGNTVSHGQFQIDTFMLLNRQTFCFLITEFCSRKPVCVQEPFSR